ncbi:MAG: zinc-ribbon domain-containing protein, partial [Candidatus Polarisedimenticolia bacterium]
MIVTCPGCGKRYRLDPAPSGPARRLRCGACGLVFA